MLFYIPCAVLHSLCNLQAYERGVALFKWPHVYDIWNTYLTKFIKRYVSIQSTVHERLYEEVMLSLLLMYIVLMKIVVTPAFSLPVSSSASL